MVSSASWSMTTSCCRYEYKQAHRYNRADGQLGTEKPSSRCRLFLQSGLMVTSDDGNVDGIFVPLESASDAMTDGTGVVM